MTSPTLHHWISTLLCALLLSGPALATAPPTDEAPPWYEIEVILFTRLSPPATLNEQWPDNPGSPDIEQARPLQPEPAPPPPPDSVTADDTIAPAEPPATPEPYALLPQEAFRLQTEFRHLQRSAELRPLLHLAWRQPVTGKETAPWLYLRAPAPGATAANETEEIIGLEGIPAEETPPVLEGTIRISVKRYLHVDLDLLLRIPSSEYDSSGAFIPEEETGMTQAPAYRRYRLQAHRRMRSGELHYIDHPLMGALIEITPYTLPEPLPAGETPAETEEKKEEEGATTPAASPAQPSPAHGTPATGAE